MIQIGNVELPLNPIILAPMEDVSDFPFRQLCKKFGADLMYTEFVSSDALSRNIAKAKKKLQIFDIERPIGIQLYGKDLYAMQEATKIATDIGPDIIDINYGCPVKKIALKGAGSGMLRDIPAMLKITEAVIKSTHLPVTVKTRLGWDEDSKNICEVARLLQDIGIQGLTIHGRTRMQLFKGLSDWTLIKKIKEDPKIKIPIFGNGDITNGKEALDGFNNFKVDGVMIGRAAIGRPWIFKEVKDFLNNRKSQDETMKLNDRIKICIEHLEKANQWHGEKGIFTIRQHYSKYFKEIENFKNIKIALMNSKTLDEAKNILLNLDQN
ncbi:MAG: tRNA dihydrouridine synthase DusB [Solitalea-like symbiont of Tyrophagus putrescentiae]